MHSTHDGESSKRFSLFDISFHLQNFWKDGSYVSVLWVSIQTSNPGSYRSSVTLTPTSLANLIDLYCFANNVAHSADRPYSTSYKILSQDGVWISNRIYFTRSKLQISTASSLRTHGNYSTHKLFWPCFTLSLGFEILQPTLSKIKVRATLRLAVYRQSVRIGVKPLETHDQRPFSFQLSPCGNSAYVISSLRRR
jgi:hypothetical protein